MRSPIPIPAFCAKRACRQPSSPLQTRPRNALYRPGHLLPVRASPRVSANSDYRERNAACRRSPQWRPVVGDRGNPCGSRFLWQSGATGIHPPQRPTPEVETKQQARSDSSSSKVQDKFSAVFTPRCVEELPKPGAGKVVLYIAWIEVIEKVEDPASGARVYALFSKVECDRSCNLQVKRGEARKTIDVSRSNIFAQFI